MAPIQTFGSYAANFHPHPYCLMTEGVWTGEGEFPPLPPLDTGVVEEALRRLVLARLQSRP